MKMPVFLYADGERVAKRVLICYTIWKRAYDPPKGAIR